MFSNVDALRTSGGFLVLGLVAFLVVGGELACGGGGARGHDAAAGAAGEVARGPGGVGGLGGTGGLGGAGGSVGNGGAPAATVGDLIPSDADIYCLNVVSPNDAIVYGFERLCTSAKRVSGPAVTAEDRDRFCATWGGKAVAACPATDPAIAYCSWMVGDPGALILEVFRVVEPGVVTPNAAAVVRDPDSSCGTAPVYDTSHRHLRSTCTGAFSASVDGVRMNFLAEHTCRFVTDGKRAVWGLNASDLFSPPLPSLRMELHKSDAGVSFGILTFGSVGITYQDTIRLVASPDAPAVKYQSDVFAEDGTALKGTFTIGANGSSSGSRTITDGMIELKFEVE